MILKQLHNVSLDNKSRDSSDELNEIKKQLSELIIRSIDDRDERESESSVLETTPEKRGNLTTTRREFQKQTDEIDAKLSAIREKVKNHLSPKSLPQQNSQRNIKKIMSVSTSSNGSPNNTAVILGNDGSNDVEKQRLRYMVIKLQKEYQNSRLREKRAIQVAREYSGLVSRHQQYVNNLKRKYLERERQILEMREMIGKFDTKFLIVIPTLNDR